LSKKDKSGFMNAKKRVQKFNPKGPENAFKGKFPKPDAFEVGSRNLMEVEKGNFAILRVNSTGLKPGEMSFHITGVEGIALDESTSILIGRLYCKKEDERFGISDTGNLITDQGLIHEFLLDRIGYVREKVESYAERWSRVEKRLRFLENRKPDDTQPGWTAEDSKRDMELLKSSLIESVRKVEALKESISQGITHLLHVSGSQTISSTQAILSIEQGQVTFIPLNDDWATSISAQDHMIKHYTKDPRDHATLSLSIQIVDCEPASSKVE